MARGKKLMLTQTIFKRWSCKSGRAIGGMLIVLLLLGVSAFAQGEPTADDIVRKMTTDLNLTPEQVSDVRIIVEDTLDKREDLLNSEVDRSALKGPLQQLSQEENRKLAQVLTSEQMEKLNSVKPRAHRGIHKYQTHAPGDKAIGNDPAMP